MVVIFPRFDDLKVSSRWWVEVTTTAHIPTGFDRPGEQEVSEGVQEELLGLEGYRVWVTCVIWVINCNNPKSLFVWWRRSSFSNPILSLFEKMIPLFIPWFLLIFPIKITISVLSIYLHIFRQTHIHITSRGWLMLLSCSAWYQSHEISPIHISIPDPISPWSLGARVAVADAARRASRGA